MLTLSFFLIFLASVSASVANFALSITLKRKATMGGYLSCYYVLSCLAAAFLNDLFSLKISFSAPMATLGGITGLMMITLMLGMAKALTAGPSGLTFAFQNSGSLIPPLILTWLFGSAYGFSLSVGNLIGMTLTLGGLFWAARSEMKVPLSRRWFIFALFTLLAQGIILTVFQWRCLLIIEGLPIYSLIPFHCLPREDLWFMPTMFFVAGLFQLLYFFYSEKRFMNARELIGGTIGGIANGFATFFLLRATWVASFDEKAMLFPMFAVFVILLCNLLGRLFYRERVNWYASACSAAGILIGTLY